MPRTEFLGRVAIIGTGQIGGSIALILKRKKVAHVVVYDIKRSVLIKARAIRLAHEYTGSLKTALAGSAVVILAAPVASIIDVLLNPDACFPTDALIMDTGSTKRLIMHAANNRRPRIHFVGGHPLAGNERIGLKGVEEQLFEAATFPLIPGSFARPSDLTAARRIVKTLGAHPMRMNAREHDRITGLTIGLPHVLAFMVRDVYENQRRKDLRTERLAGSSLWSTMRVSKSDPLMVGDFIASNRDNVEYWWRRTFDKSTAKSKKPKGPLRRLGPSI